MHRFFVLSLAFLPGACWAGSVLPNAAYYSYSDWISAFKTYSLPYSIVPLEINTQSFPLAVGAESIGQIYTYTYGGAKISFVGHSIVGDAAGGTSTLDFPFNSGFPVLGAYATFTLTPVLAGLSFGNQNMPDGVAAPGQSFSGFFGFTNFGVSDDIILGGGDLAGLPPTLSQHFSLTNMVVAVAGTVSPSPEPSTEVLFGIGFVGGGLLVFRGRSKRRS